jgi:hypothetical protein
MKCDSLPVDRSKFQLAESEIAPGMNRRFASLICAVAVLVALLARPAAALDPIPPSIAQETFQNDRQTLAPLAACQVDAIYATLHPLVLAADANTSVPSLFSASGVPADQNAQQLVMLTLLLLLHAVDKNQPEKRAVIQPLEKAASRTANSFTISGNNLNAGAAKMAPGACAGLSPTVIFGPDGVTIGEDNNSFRIKRKAIAAFLKPSMAARLTTIASSLQSDGSAITARAVFTAVQSHLGDVPDSEAQLYLIEYVAIQEALDGQPIATGRPATVAAQLLYQQQIAYWNALQDLQKKMPARAQYAIVATLGS